MDRGVPTGRVLLTYREHRPHPSIAHVVACYWQIRGSLLTGASHPHRVLPDACVDLVFDLAAARARSQALAGQIVGTMTRASCIAFRGEVDVFGVRFKPGGAATLCGDSVRELTDSATPADLWLGSAASMLVERLAPIDAIDQRARLIEPFLLRMIGRRGIDRLVASATLCLNADGVEPRSVAAVARSLGVAERQLERRFSAATGLAPVVYRRVQRFRRLLATRARASLPWAHAAAEAGYFDQAHMSREFARLAGVSVAQWSLEQRHVGFVQDGRVTVR